MRSIYLKIYSTNLEVLAKNQENYIALNWLSEDFNYFQNEKEDTANSIILEINEDENPFFYEEMKEYILSVAGEILEKSGWMRLHALGIQNNFNNLAFHLPSKGGKSSMATEHLLHSNEKIFSDEIVFTNGYSIRAFPISIALSERAAEDLNISTEKMRYFKKRKYQAKYLSPIPIHRVANEDVLDMVYVVNSNPMNFVWSSFWGLGLPQIAKYLIRWNNLFGLIQMALTRVKVLYILFSNRKIKFIKLSEKPLKINSLWKKIELKNKRTYQTHHIKEMDQRI